VGVEGVDWACFELAPPMLTYVLLEMMRARETERGFGQGEIGREV